ncbi:hypothetical protein CES85_5854 (plasmid) [Ochrobactrum quorumnocens]|uniref:Uncharacterized protein n=1 Tax=Ochrobactrum quorumnocens TaxID=271865 RepID=A0A248U8D7_9HYPH|nr:hypothetical protein CES85_5854 [[Ochrobactrum] quorumnocens]
MQYDLRITYDCILIVTAGCVNKSNYKKTAQIALSGLVRRQ